MDYRPGTKGRRDFCGHAAENSPTLCSFSGLLPVSAVIGKIGGEKLRIRAKLTAEDAESAVDRTRLARTAAYGIVRKMGAKIFQGHDALDFREKLLTDHT